MFDSKYFREYRQKLGFNSAVNAKAFFGAKDLLPTIDYGYIESLNNRLCDIVIKINEVVNANIKKDDIYSFYNENIIEIYKILNSNYILPRLNNQGRRREDVYFSWMRGFVISNYFLESIGKIFNVNLGDIDLIGDDDLKNIDTFKRTPKADLEVKLLDGSKFRIEVQSGFQGINDIKQHKVLEAKRIRLQERISSIVIHFDIFNGQAAFINIDSIEDDSVNWITRQQLEGQTVFNIDQNYFVWKLTDEPPSFEQISSIL